MTQHLDLEAWSCPVPLRDHPNVVMGHGGGGTLSSELVTHLFLPAYGDDGGVLAQLGDAAVLSAGGGRIAMSTDSFVVRPRFFPGGVTRPPGSASTSKSTTSFFRSRV